MCNRNNTQDNSKMGRDENVSLETLGKICEYFQCEIGDIIEYKSMGIKYDNGI